MMKKRIQLFLLGVISLTASQEALASEGSVNNLPLFSYYVDQTVGTLWQGQEVLKDNIKSMLNAIEIPPKLTLKSKVADAVINTQNILESAEYMMYVTVIRKKESRNIVNLVKNVIDLVNNNEATLKSAEIALENIESKFD